MTDDTPQVSERMNEVAHAALDFLETSGEFVVEQAPLALREFMLWRTIEHGVTAVACFLFVAGFLVAAKWVVKKVHYAVGDGILDDGSEFVAVGGIVVLALGFVGSIFCLINGCIHTLQFIKINVAPRVYLIEEFGKWIG